MGEKTKNVLEGILCEVCSVYLPRKRPHEGNSPRTCYECKEGRKERR